MFAKPGFRVLPAVLNLQLSPADDSPADDLGRKCQAGFLCALVGSAINLTESKEQKQEDAPTHQEEESDAFGHRRLQDV